MFGIDPETLIAVLSIILTMVATYLLKGYITSRTPTGRKDGIADLHVVLAFATVAVIALTTKDPLTISLTALLAYLVSKSRYDAKKSYIYQIVISIALGISLPYLSFLLYERYTDGGYNSSSSSRNSRNSGSSYSDDSSDSPRESYDVKEGKDERDQADEAPELKLESSLTDEEKELIESLDR